MVTPVKQPAVPNVPAARSLYDLKSYEHWVCYDARKVPVSPRTGRAASCIDQATWGTYAQARQFWTRQRSRVAGLGFMLTRELGMTVIDLDHCIVDGQISEFAQQIVARLDSYTEYSPSGTGLHIWVQGELPENLAAASKADGENRIEMYTHARYLTVTGKSLHGEIKKPIEHRQDYLMELYQTILSRRQRVKSGTRAQVGESPYGLAALQNECRELQSTPEGGRNQALNDAAFKMGQLVAANALRQETAYHELFQAASLAGLPEREIERTLSNALAAGMRFPRELPATAPRSALSTIDEEESLSLRTDVPVTELPTMPATGSGRLVDGGSIDPELLLEYEKQGEYGDALLLASQISDSYVYDCTEKQWYIKTGHYYTKDSCNSLASMVPALLPAIYIDGAEHYRQRSQEAASQNPQDVETYTSLLKKAKVLNARAGALTQVRRYRHIVYFTGAQDSMNLTSEAWDQDLMTIALSNCLLDLRTGQTREWRSGDMIRTVCPTAWEGLEAPCPRFEQALHESFADLPLEQRQARIAYLQRFIGYGLTGSCREHKALLFYGPEGRNGKDTIIRALTDALGPFSGTVSKDIFLDTGRMHTPGSHSAHLLHLRHKRLAWANEPQQGGKLNVALLKELTGGGAITARGAYERELVTFQPTHTLFINTNHLPYASAEDQALWERLHVLPFKMRFVENPVSEYERPRDIHLAEQLRAEASGILAWVVRGCLEWQRSGLMPPDEILQATREYRDEQDTLQRFLDECCTRKEEAKVAANVLYRRYCEWCREGNMKALHIQNFGRQLVKKGLEKMHTENGNVYQGLELLPEE